MPSYAILVPGHWEHANGDKIRDELEIGRLDAAHWQVFGGRAKRHDDGLEDATYLWKVAQGSRM